MTAQSLDSFKTAAELKVGNKTYFYFSLKKLEQTGLKVRRLPYSLRILLENLLRHEDKKSVSQKDIEALMNWNPTAQISSEIAFTPARVILQDFTGVPCVVDLAAMRDAMVKLKGDPKKINPLQPVELVIDHSVQVDVFGTADSLKINSEIEFERNKERYSFLKWGQKAFENFKVVPPETGIVHQVNLEYLARVVMTSDKNLIYPDTLVGTDSHTTMINGLGVLGWGVGGIEAEAAMLGQPQTMLIPQVIGFKMEGKLHEGTTATDLVLTVTQILRKKGVVGKFVEFFGPGAATLSLADRATVANMAPEYGATCGFFPVDEETLRYLALTGRSDEQIELIRAYLTEQELFWTPKSPVCEYSEVLSLDLSTVQTSMAGPSRPQDRVTLSAVKSDFLEQLSKLKPQMKSVLEKTTSTHKTGDVLLNDGSVVIAAITSCTNTSNPSVLIGAGLLAKKAVERGMRQQPWVKTSLAPGSQVVTEYLKVSGLLPYLEQLGFNVVGYGCTTCIGNSGPLDQRFSQQIKDQGLVAAAVLSGNRNFEGRVHPEVRANYLASPPLVVAYALAGRIDIDLTSEPLGTGNHGDPVYLKNIWPSSHEIEEVIQKTITSKMFSQKYRDVFTGDKQWQNLAVRTEDNYQWDHDSTYVQNPPYFKNIQATPSPVLDILKARVLAIFGDSVTTDHISPAGSIKQDSPAGKYLIDHGVKVEHFNSYGSRRGNHEVMMRGTFANPRIKNRMLQNVEGGMTKHCPDGELMSIFDASIKYQKEKIPLVVIAGKEYGSGSSRDWAAKGPSLLGVRVVLAESFERIHRSNLVGMGILPLQFLDSQSATTLNLTGDEIFSFTNLQKLKPQSHLTFHYTQQNGEEKSLQAVIRIDTPVELEYYRHGGILHYVLRQLL